jgi:hypothetical protein
MSEFALVLIDHTIEILHVKNASSDTPSVTEGCKYRKDISMSVGHNTCCVRVLDPRTFRVKNKKRTN